MYFSSEPFRKSDEHRAKRGHKEWRGGLENEHGAKHFSCGLLDQFENAF